MTDDDANDYRLIANEIMHRLWSDGHRDQLQLLLDYANEAMKDLEKKHEAQRKDT